MRAEGDLKMEGASDGEEVKKVGPSYQICLARHQKQLVQFLEAEMEMQLQS